MDYNTSPISLTEGKAYIDGVEVMDLVDFELLVTPKVWTGTTVGDRSPSSRWLGYAVTGKITRRRSNNWLTKILANYKKNGKTPELKMQGKIKDKDSDYYKKYGALTVTAVGCVLTGDLSLMKLDTNGEVLEDNISFNAKDYII